MNWATTYTLDLGNSNPSVGEFLNNELISVIPLIQFLQGPRIPGAVSICSEVRTHLPPDLVAELKPMSPVDYFTAGRLFNLPVHYATTLGADRLVQAYALFNEFFTTENAQASSIQLIDSGTFTTVDLITANGFEGGHIIPGLNLLSRSFTMGEKLPALTLEQVVAFYPRKDEMPQTTHHAMGLGVWQMLKGFFTEWHRQHRPEKIILTGGQAQVLLPLLREISSTSIEVRSNLIHHALFSLAHKIVDENLHRISSPLEEPLCPTY